MITQEAMILMKRLCVSLPWLAGMLICLWFLYMFVSWYIGEGTFQQKAATLTTTGSIVEITESDNIDTGESCNLTISFVTRQKQRIDFSPQLGDCSHHVGDVVTIAYHVGKPQEAQVGPPGGSWRGNLGTVIFAGLLFVILFIAALMRFILAVIGKGDKEASSYNL
jgi:hypothetical protein